MKNNSTLKITKKNLRGEDGFKTFSVRIKNEVVENIDAIAAKTNRSRNELIGILLDFALNNCEISDEN